MEVTAGVEQLTRYQKCANGVTRSFCRVCGSRVQNVLHKAGVKEEDSRVGFFPALLEEATQHNLPAAFRPTRHYLGEETVLKLEMFPALPDANYATPWPPAAPHP